MRKFPKKFLDNQKKYQKHFEDKCYNIKNVSKYDEKIQQ